MSTMLCPIDHFVYDIWQIRAATESETEIIIYFYPHTFHMISALLTGVMHAKMNNGADESPNSHLHPRFGATANAKATSKHAPRAQKH